MGVCAHRAAVETRAAGAARLDLEVYALVKRRARRDVSRVRQGINLKDAAEVRLASPSAAS